VSGKPTSAPGLFFCGAIASPTGQLREIGIEAERIAKLAKKILAHRSLTAKSPNDQEALPLDRYFVALAPTRGNEGANPKRRNDRYLRIPLKK
jgi:hypothetical protein